MADSETASQLPSVKLQTTWTPANADHLRKDSESTTDTPPAVGSSERHSPPAKRRREDRERTRVSRACDRCKRKKTRCTGKCPCALCLRAGLPCEFTASYTRGRLPSVVVDDSVDARSIMAEEPGAPSKDLGTSTSHYPRIYPSPSAARAIYPVPNSMNAPNDYTARVTSQRNSPEPQGAQRDQQGHYVGTSSAVSFLIRIQKRLHQDSSLSHESTIFTFGDAPLPDLDPSFFVLPPKPDAQRLVERYFDYAAPTHRFLHRPSIEKLLEEFYDTQGEMRGREDVKAKAGLLMVVFAQAQAYTPMEGNARSNSARYFFAAEHQLSNERGAVRLTSVQARLLQCFYLLTQSRINHCWSLFGTLAHLALAIGLNRGRKCDPSSAVDYVELESRRRTFWCAYSLDKYLAAALGRPRTFKDEDIDQELPTVVNDNDLHPTYINPTPSKSHSLMMAPVEHIKLTQIVSLVLRDLYSIRPPSLAERIKLSTQYTDELHKWRNALSGFLNNSSADGGIDSHMLIPIYQRQRSVLNLAYNHALLLIHRPFLLRDFASLTHMPTNPSWGVSGPINAANNITACLDAALAIVRVVDDVFTSSNQFRCFWFTQYYAFCAVVVLYIYRIQQGLGIKAEFEGYFEAGMKCQAQLKTVSETGDCLARRYWLVLEELRVEVVRQSGKLSTITTPAPPPSNFTPKTDSETADLPHLGMSLPPLTPHAEPASPSSPFYSNNNNNSNNTLPIPENSIYNTDYFSDNGTMSELTGWPAFDSFVTSGTGLFDSGFPADNLFGSMFGM